MTYQTLPNYQIFQKNKSKYIEESIFNRIKMPYIYLKLILLEKSLRASNRERLESKKSSIN